MQAQPSTLPWLGPVLPGAEVFSLVPGTSADMSGQFALVPKCLTDTSAPVPKCLGSEVSWVRSVLTPVGGTLLSDTAQERVCRNTAPSLPAALAHSMKLHPALIILPKRTMQFGRAV